MEDLCQMVEVFQETPTSDESPEPHRSGFASVIPLKEEEIQRIWDYVPWNDSVPGDHVNECAQLAELFDGIDPVQKKDLRDAAFHLLWYAQELALDREPITTDSLPPDLRQSQQSEEVDPSELPITVRPLSQ
jgi:hypothetical protein